MPNNELEGYRGNKQLKLPNTKEYIDVKTFQFRKSELKKVIWPTAKQTAKNTFAVLFLVILPSIISKCKKSAPLSVIRYKFSKILSL